MEHFNTHATEKITVDISKKQVEQDSIHLAEKVLIHTASSINEGIKKIHIIPIPKGGLKAGKTMYETFHRDFESTLKIHTTKAENKKDFYKEFKTLTQKTRKDSLCILVDDLIDSGKTLAPLINEAVRTFQTVVVALLYKKQGVPATYLDSVPTENYSIIVEKTLPNHWFNLPHEEKGIKSNVDVLCDYAHVPHVHPKHIDGIADQLLHFLYEDMKNVKPKKALHTYLGSSFEPSETEKEQLIHEIIRIYQYFGKKIPDNIEAYIEPTLFFLQEQIVHITNVSDTKELRSNEFL